MSKILFTDCDGTLLTTDKNICEKNRVAIKKLVTQGHKIVLASGRSLFNTLSQAESLNLTFDGCYLISFNGGQIYDIYNKKTIYKSHVPFSVVEEIFKLGQKAGVHVQTYDDNCVLSYQRTKELEQYCETLHCDCQLVSSISEYMEDPPSKVLLVEYNQLSVLEELRIQISEHFGKLVDCFFSYPPFLEIVAKGTNKGDAVQTLCNYLDIPIENSVSAGDGLNDISLLQATHIGAAVKNAASEVKEVADYITTLDNNEGAIAEIIEKFIL